MDKKHFANKLGKNASENSSLSVSKIEYEQQKTSQQYGVFCYPKPTIQYITTGQCKYLAENDLENTKNHLETENKEVQKPFIQEEELKTKLARLDELNILLNMDKRENEIVGGEPVEGEVPNTRKEKTYER